MEKLYIGARIRHLREDRGLTQAALARALDLSPSYLNQIEHDRRPLTVSVLLRITGAFGVDADFFAAQDTARTIAELRETLTDTAVDVELSHSELADLATNLPSVAKALIQLRRRYRDRVDHTAAVLGRDATEVGDVVATKPHEEVRDFLSDRENHIASLDEAAEQLADDVGIGAIDPRAALSRRLDELHGVRVAPQPQNAPIGELRHYDSTARVLRLSRRLHPGQQAFQLAIQIALLEHDEHIEELVAEAALSSDARALARIGLAQYYAGATLMPYQTFHNAAEGCRYDIELLSDQFRVGFEAVCHRLSTLQRPRLRGVPFLFVRVDRAGNVSKRQSATGFHFSRGGGTCPLWNVYEAFSTPGRILTQLAEMPDGRSYLWVARTVARKQTGYGMPSKLFAVGLGCELRHAHRLVYARGLDLGPAASTTPIGSGCSTCERLACPQRAAPQVGRPLDIDEHRSRFVPYMADVTSRADPRRPSTAN